MAGSKTLTLKPGEPEFKPQKPCLQRKLSMVAHTSNAPAGQAEVGRGGQRWTEVDRGG